MEPTQETVLMPEDQFPKLGPVYRQLGLKRAADVLDAIVLSYPSPASKADIMEHLYGRRNGDYRYLASWIGQVRCALRSHDLDLRKDGGDYEVVGLGGGAPSHQNRTAMLDDLSAREIEILQILIDRPVARYTELRGEAPRHNVTQSKKAIRVHIWALRRRGIKIRVVRGYGYRLLPSERERLQGHV